MGQTDCSRVRGNRKPGCFALQLWLQMRLKVEATVCKQTLPTKLHLEVNSILGLTSLPRGSGRGSGRGLRLRPMPEGGSVLLHRKLRIPAIITPGEILFCVCSSEAAAHARGPRYDVTGARGGHITETQPAARGWRQHPENHQHQVHQTSGGSTAHKVSKTPRRPRSKVKSKIRLTFQMVELFYCS